MNPTASRLHDLVHQIERNDVLDAPGTILQQITRRITAPDRVKAALSGATLGHRIHPLLTDVPIGTWTSATIVDLVAGRAGRRAARRLTGIGILAALPTAATGLSDWEDTHGGTRRVGVVHASANTLGLLLQVASWRARGRGRHGRGAVLGLLGLGAVSVGGYLGGHLAYGAGVGVDHTIPVPRSGRWHAVGSIDDLLDGHPLGVTVDGARVALVRTGERVHALAATCSHAGGPLDDGDVRGGALRCPWHGSAFCLTDGSVERGPAATGQPVFETRVVQGMVEIRLSAPVGTPAETARAAEPAGARST